MKYLIGIGNYTMGDDGIGLRVVEYIVDNDLDREFKAIDLSANVMNLLFYFKEDTERIVIVDAVKMGRKPGEILIFSPDSVETEKELSGITTHESDILKVIVMGKNLGYPVPHIEILGVEPEKMEPIMELSETLQFRFQTYVDAAIKAITA